MSGFVALYRDAAEHSLFVGDSARFGAWLWLVSKACWKPTPFNINGKTVQIQRGQVCASRAQLAAAWGWKPSAVERFLTRLETEQMIGRAAGQGRSVITICNYAKYQDLNEQTGQATGQATGQRSDRHRTTKEQENKGTIDPNGSKTPLTPLPDWMPMEAWEGYLKARGKVTPRAKQLMIGKLERWRAQGHDPAAILDQSTLNGWTGLFEPKEQSNGRQKPNHAQDGAAAALDRQLGLGEFAGTAGRQDAGGGQGDLLYLSGPDPF